MGSHAKVVLFFCVACLAALAGCGTSKTGSAHPAQYAYSGDLNGKRAVFLRNADGSAMLALTDEKADDLGPVWSPDGETLAFFFNDAATTEIYTMKPDGSG